MLDRLLKKLPKFLSFASTFVVGTLISVSGFWLYRKLITKRCLKKGPTENASSQEVGTMKTNPYPETSRGDHYDEYFGIKVHDSYRWLEDPHTEETKDWIHRQIDYSTNYFSTLGDVRKTFADKLTSLNTYDKYNSTWKAGDKYYFYKKMGLENQFVLYQQDSLDSEPRKFIDLNPLRSNGTAALSSVYFSDQGEYCAYTVCFNGSDWNTTFIRDTKTFQDLPDKIEWSKFSNISWIADGSGFFYSRYPAPSIAKEDSAGTETDAVMGQRIFFHRIGTYMEADQMIFSSPENPKWMYTMKVTDDGKTLLIFIRRGSERVNKVYYMNLNEFDGKDINTLGKCVRLFDSFETKYDYITNKGRDFYFLTKKNAPKYRVVKVTIPDKNDPIEDDELALSSLELQDVVPESDSVLESAVAFDTDKILLCYLQHVTHHLEIVKIDGYSRYSIQMPGFGSVSSIATEKDTNEFFFNFACFENPVSIYRGIVKNLENEETKTQEKQKPFTVTINRIKCSELQGLKPEEFTVKQIFYQSKDGTEIPMFIVQSSQDTNQNKCPRPCILYGYGGFNISITPGFELDKLIFVKHFGGIYAIANIRGGGEYGEEWHQAGIGPRKQNVFDDFICAAEYLISKNYTTSKQLAIHGRSNGGLLVGACINQRPQLFAAAVAGVGVMDMLRFHKFTIGYAWCSNYGCSEKSKEEFETLLKYSPLHNVRNDIGPYPAVLLTTADHDDRVVPLHSFKLISELQNKLGANQEQENPLLIRIETQAGHGIGKPTHKVIEELSDIHAFISHHTQARWQD